MTDRRPMPAAMPAHVAERLSDVREEPRTEPDFSEVDDVSAVAPYELHAPIAKLIGLAHQVKQIRAWGALNESKALDEFLEFAAEIEEGLTCRWNML